MALAYDSAQAMDGSSDLPPPRVAYDRTPIHRGSVFAVERVTFRDDAGRVIVRPSGTEPKLKCYLEVVVPVSESDVSVARAQADVLLNAIRDDLSAHLRP